MAHPKWNTTKGKRNKRRMHLFIKPAAISVCPKCGQPLLSHTACLNCGYYKTNEVIDVMKKLTKKEKKLKEKEIAVKEAEESQKDKKPLTWEEMSKK